MFFTIIIITIILYSNSICCVEISCYFAKMNGLDWPVSMVTIL